MSLSRRALPYSPSSSHLDSQPKMGMPIFGGNFNSTTLHYNTHRHSVPYRTRSNHAEQPLHASIGLKFQTMVQWRQLTLPAVGILTARAAAHHRRTPLLPADQQLPSLTQTHPPWLWTQFARHNLQGGRCSLFPNNLQGKGVQVIFKITCRGGRCRLFPK